MAAIDEGIRFNHTIYYSEDRISRNLDLSAVVGNVTKALFVDFAIKSSVSLVKSGVSTVKDIIIDTKSKPNEEYLKAKKLSRALNLIDKDILQSRIMMGISSLTTSSCS